MNVCAISAEQAADALTLGFHQHSCYLCYPKTF